MDEIMGDDDERPWYALPIEPDDDEKRSLR
jgi:hypothetical protein